MDTDAIKPESTEKPWGSFRRFTLNEKSTVKILFVKKGEEFSLQDHEHRMEFWRVIKGKPVVTIQERAIHAAEGEEFTVKAGTPHRVAAPEGDVEILEISIGDFDEADITRLADKYGRA